MSTDAIVDLLAREDGDIEIAGDGAAAAELRRVLAGRLARDGARPAIVVETSGTAEAVQAALARVAVLGTVVTAGPAPEGPVALDFYADLHVRGLTLIGVA